MGSSLISGTSSECSTLLFSSSTTTARAFSPLSGPSAISTPYLLPNSRFRNVESETTLLRPSAVQKRLDANGRSAEITSTTVSVMPEAFWLKVRVEVAQTGVSRLGTMFSTLRLPA